MTMSGLAIRLSSIFASWYVSKIFSGGVAGWFIHPSLDISTIHHFVRAAKTYFGEGKAAIWGLEMFIWLL